MPPKNGTGDVELKVRIPRELMDELNDYRHMRKLDSRKEAIIELLRGGLDASNGGNSSNNGSNGTSAAQSEDIVAKEGQNA